MTVKNKYHLRQQVFLITDPDQLPRFVTGIMIRDEHLLYYLTSGIEETPHFDFEISNTKNYKFGEVNE